MALFDDDLDNITKDEMVIAMKEKEGEEKALKSATIDVKLIQEKIRLSDQEIKASFQ